jgi:hypothetical protein
MKTMRTAVLAALVGGTAACGGSSSPELKMPAASVDSVPTDSIRASALAQAPALAVTEAFRVSGGDEGEALFTNIRSMDIAQGKLYVADGLSNYIRTYDSSGQLMQKFGGHGAGPGELDQVFLITVTNDSVLVVDSRGINIFSTAGEFRTRTPINIVLLDKKGRVQVRSFPRTIDATTEGLLVSEDLTPRLLMGSSPVPAPDSVWLHHLATDGTLGPRMQTVQKEVKYHFGGAGVTHAHFAPEVHFAVAHDARVMVTDGDGTTFDIYHDGERQHRVRFLVDRKPVTNEDLAELFARRKAVWDKPLPANTSAPKNFREELDRGHRKIPHYPLHPVVGQLLVSDDMILVNRPDLGGSSFKWDASAQPSRWTALSSDYKVIGTVELPVGFAPYALREGLVVGTIVDEDDIPSIVAYRITAAPVS